MNQFLRVYPEMIKFKFCSKEGSSFFPRGDVAKNWKYTDNFETFSFAELQSILGWRVFKFVRMKDHTPFQGEIITTLNQAACIIITLLRFVHCLDMLLRWDVWSIGLLIILISLTALYWHYELYPHLHCDVTISLHCD